jgi:adenine-specific DNA-methyltransferase
MILFYTKTSSPIWNEPKEKHKEVNIEKLYPKKDKNGRRYTTVPIHAPGETVNGDSSKRLKGYYLLMEDIGEQTLKRSKNGIGKD